MIRLKRLTRHHALILKGNRVLAKCLRGAEKRWFLLTPGKHPKYLHIVGPQEHVEDSLLIYIQKVYFAPRRKNHFTGNHKTGHK